MSVAREGLTIIMTAVLLAAAAYFVAVTRRSWPYWLIAYALTIIALWTVYFFRDPERTGPRGDNVVIAPADGQVVLITEVDEPSFMKGRVVRISIFMNIFNVHVNRYPIAGQVGYVQHTPGTFVNAMAESASLENEQTSIGIGAGPGRVMMRQIAGLIARRIVTYSKVGDAAKQGERMGLIRFGSRVDVFVPKTAHVRVAVGDKASAGVTVLAEMDAR